MSTLKDGKTEKVAELISMNHPRPITSILVVGCGSGIEAAILAQTFHVNVTGIDLISNFDREAKKSARLEIGDAMSLQFSDGSFDFIYSYHTLEHIADPLLALKEMRRVLKNGGGYWIGTPNKNRIIGYIGSKDATLGQKVKWNINDWKARMEGKFLNELGAHAGFTSSELALLLTQIFSKTINMSDMYFKAIYEKKIPNSLLKLHGISEHVYPSIYFMGTK